ncbi:MAG TPA: hypothetical protein VGP94_17130, partial [Tepidisphaeraceae bacterium]|nr:hypothetical protein [Tepidisphaeraceae bacterium]
PLLVRNVAPTAVLSSGGPINEMSPGILRFTSIFDPSAADTAAGFGFSYDLNNDGDYRDAGEAENVLASKWNYTFPDNGTYIVAARITDRDGGSSVYTTAVIVNNVPPTASISLLDDKANHGKKPLHRKKVSTFSLAAIDVSPIDQKSPFKFSIDWDGDGKIDEILTSSSSNLTVNHVFGHKGDFTIKAFATDKDGQMGPAALLTVRVV